MLKYKEEEKSLKQYISDNNDKIQNMNQDSHNVAVALLNQNLPKLIDNQKGDFRMVEKHCKQFMIVVLIKVRSYI